MASPRQPLVLISSFKGDNEGGIYAYHLDMVTGRLDAGRRVADVERPFFMATSVDGKYLYVNHAPGEFGGKPHEELAAYEILDREGKLRFLNRANSLGSATCYVDVDATGNSVAVANYETGNFVLLPTKADGRLSEATVCIQHEGSSLDKSRQEGPHTHCTLVSPNNVFLYVADLGTDRVVIYRLAQDDSGITLKKHSQATLQPGSGPRHLVFHPNGQHVYVINELSNSITVFECEEGFDSLREIQTVSTLPGDFTGESCCADLKITPDGRWLYGSNRGHESIARYEINDEGELQLLGIDPSGGKEPQNLAITSGGEFLLCANMISHNIVVFCIDSRDGSITPTDQQIALQSPSCIKIL